MKVLPRRGRSHTEILDKLSSILGRLPVYREGVLGSTTTIPLMLAQDVFRMFQYYNANDEWLYSEISKLEEEAIAMIAEIVGCGGKECIGMITSGGSESNLAALFLAREHGYRRVYFARTVHDSIIKSSYILGLEVVVTPYNPWNYKLDPSMLLELISRRGPGLVVATIGTTGFGTIDPIESIAEVARRTGSVVHIDAAYGGFIAPFVYKNIKLGFENDEVVSITVDPHKLGGAPIPAGAIITRDREWFKPLVFPSSHLPAGVQKGLLGTRTAGSIAATWAALVSNGYLGYEQQAHRLMNLSNYLINTLKERGIHPVVEPDLPIICLPCRDVSESIKTLAKNSVYVYKCGLVDGLKITIMPHVSKNLIDKFVKIYIETCI